ncbi:hypothetical protein GCM10010363_54700 [Streptomyces omiyaensis]|nr:hypothetical protein GCM10010363_54700 [Streptomyces omiyaensis]
MPEQGKAGANPALTRNRDVPRARSRNALPRDVSAGTVEEYGAGRGPPGGTGVRCPHERQP